MKSHLLAVALACATLTHAPLTTAAPPKGAKAAEAVNAQGFSPERLKRLDAAIAAAGL